ncbi:MAG: hypothetical protein R6U31_07495, partial [bacterium]
SWVITPGNSEVFHSSCHAVVMINHLSFDVAAEEVITDEVSTRGRPRAYTSNKPPVTSNYLPWLLFTSLGTCYLLLETGFPSFTFKLLPSSPPLPQTGTPAAFRIFSA